MKRAVLLMVAFLAGCPSSYEEPQLPLPLPPDAAVQLTTELDEAAAVRYRYVRPDIAIDCELVDQLQGRVRPADIALSWFGAERTLAVQRNRPGAITRRAGRRCDLLRIERDSGEVALLTLTPNNVQHIQVTTEGVGGSYGLWPDPGERVDEQRERCASESLRVSWSEPIPVGQRMRVETADSEAGCTDLELTTASTTVDWRVCAGASDVPLVEGDIIDVTLTGTQNGTVRIERIGAEPLTMWLGGGPVARNSDAPNGPNMSFARDDACRLERLECGMISLPVRLDVRLGRRSMQLRAGERVLLSDERGSLEVNVGAAAQVPIASASCEASVGSHARFFAVERGKRTAKLVRQ